MHPYLSRLGIYPDIQRFFAPFYHSDKSGNLCFSYGQETEIYGLSFHRVPAAEHCWIAGGSNHNQVYKVMICSSAMEAIAWLNCHYAACPSIETLLFIAVGSHLKNDHLKFIRKTYPCRKYGLLFSNDLLGCIWDLKAASILREHQAGISAYGEYLLINFKNRVFRMIQESFSLNAFERLSCYRFHMQTHKSKPQLNWLRLLEEQSLNL